MKVLVTGGLGYPGAHLCLQMLQQGVDVVALDQWSDSSRIQLQGLQRLLGRRLRLVEGQSSDPDVVRRLLASERIQAVVHLEQPAWFEKTDDQPSLQMTQALEPMACLLNEMDNAGVFQLHVASSAHVYGSPPSSTPIRESAPTRPDDPSGVLHLMIEELLNGLPRADRRWTVGVYRLFGIGGCHPSGLLSPMTPGDPGQFLNRACLAAAHGTPAETNSQLPTEDGSPVRDLIHVDDAAAALLAGILCMDTYGDSFTVNIGTGKGVSELQTLDAVRQTAGRHVAWLPCMASSDTPAWQVADMAYATEVLGWRAQRSLNDICRTAWAWFDMNRARLQAV